MVPVMLRERAFTPYHGSPALECGPRSNKLERGGEEGKSPKGDSPKPRALARGTGFTLIEVVVASLLAAILAGGTLISFLVSAKITRESVTVAEATAYAAQTIEEFRNEIACDQPWFNDPGIECGFSGIDGELPVTLTSHDLPPAAQSALRILEFNTTREYEVWARDCDGDTVVGDCYQVTVRLTWEQPT